MADPIHASFLPPIVTFCAAALVAVPIARRLGVGGVLGYLAAGVIMGPSALGLVADPASLRQVAELGVVLLLFIIGLELKPSRLITMRRDIFGLGLAQMVVSGVVIGLAAWRLGLPPVGAAVVGIALALSATAVALQILDERGDLQAPYGQRAFAVLLFQDLSIVPILAVVPLLAGAGADSTTMQTGLAVLKGVVALGALIGAGLYLLNPLFRLIAPFGARELMTAAALLVVLGSAMLMEEVGLSMALGAFLAGLLLAESNFKHQLEADIEPFRGLLLGLFFMSVGMGLDLKVLIANALPLILITLLLVLGKIVIAEILLRASCSSRTDSWRAGALLSPAGEFSFVLAPMAAGLGLMSQDHATMVTAAAALTMFFGPVTAKLIEIVIARREAKRAQLMSDLPVENFDGAQGSVLVIGFGRFAQVVNQVMVAEGVDVTVIDTDVETIQAAARFGFKVYFGDGSRLDVLHAAGAERARVVAVCVDDQKKAIEIVELLHAHFPLAKIYARAYDRRHAIELMNRGVDFLMRETFLSAIGFGAALLRELGVSPERAREVVEDVRERDEKRLQIQQAEGIMGGAHLVRPQPLSEPKAKTRALTDETRALIEEKSA
ncbi:monovalent cation:proton antiporter-2 (CPA2) family protein [Terrarubrum flagellatum]|uniref:monovalent cation:proton antiporter-2 (CPA2) family protein n=1 Tax=Terrirubrum flagellatum TaxID=2895980 RepID=UPI0031450730